MPPYKTQRLRRPPSLPRSRTTTTTTSAASPLEQYGIIYTLKDGFGFIQCLFSDDQVYFNDRSTHVMSKLAVGMAVEFIKRSDSKGSRAEHLRILDSSLKVSLPNINGVIVRESIAYKSTTGLISIAKSELEPYVSMYPQLLGIFQKFPSSTCL